MSRLSRSFFMLVAIFILAGCQPAKTKGLLNTLAARPPLKVGITADSPPLAYKKNDVIGGLEAGFAAGLAKSVQRSLELVALPREELAKALREGKIDIVMAGMTVAQAHNHRLATADPYLVSGQTALVHLDDFKQLGTGVGNLAGRDVRLGVVAASSGENLIRGLKPKGTTSRFASAPEGVQALIADTIDVFIFDMPANYYYAALHVDKGLTPGVALLTREPLAWAVRPNDAAMRKAANTYLAAIVKDGTLHTMIERALPFYRNTAYSPRQ